MAGALSKFISAFSRFPTSTSSAAQAPMPADAAVRETDSKTSDFATARLFEFSLEGMPIELTVRIGKLLNPTDLGTIGLVSKPFNRLSSNLELNIAFADTIGCPIPFPIDRRCGPRIQKQIQVFIKKLRERAKSACWLPEDIKQLLQKSDLSVDEINRIQACLAAIEILRILRKLFKEASKQGLNLIGEAPSIYDLASSENIIAAAKKFEPMFEQNKNAFVQLRRLRLSSSGLTSLPRQLSTLTQLEVLDLSHNQLTELPPWIGDLSRLGQLDLSNNELSSLPTELGKLQHIEELSIAHNHFISLPHVIGKLTHLRKLLANNNQIASIPSWIGNLSQLETLYLSCNKLTSLPIELFNLSQLRILDLSHNQIVSLPRRVANLHRLEELYLCNNRLTLLPRGIFNLARLRRLALNHNQLTSLPTGNGWGNLVNLAILDISYNQLTSFPPEIAHLPNLDRLFLDSNPLSSLPPGIQNLIDRYCRIWVDSKTLNLQVIGCEFRRDCKERKIEIASAAIGATGLYVSYLMGYGPLVIANKLFTTGLDIASKLITTGPAECNPLTCSPNHLSVLEWCYPSYETIA